MPRAASRTDTSTANASASKFQQTGLGFRIKALMIRTRMSGATVQLPDGAVYHPIT